MKNTLALALLAVASLPLAAHAEGSYIGGGVGRAEHKVAVNSIGSYKDSDVAIKIFTGYNFDKNFGIEAGYSDLGEIEAGNTGISVKGRSFYAAGTATLALNEKLSLTGKLGVAKNRARMNLPGGDLKDTKTDTLLSVSAAYEVTKNLAAYVEIENYGNMAQPKGGGSLKVKVISTGLRFSF
ncbi:porin family protein [Massilia aquatica]|uniref:porin family protein n=1 Tax=Massilia aquatica TaxID=2609000 RepID=UPI00141DDE15